VPHAGGGLQGRGATPGTLYGGGWDKKGRFVLEGRIPSFMKKMKGARQRGERRRSGRDVRRSKMISIVSGRQSTSKKKKKDEIRRKKRIGQTGGKGKFENRGTRESSRTRRGLESEKKGPRRQGGLRKGKESCGGRSARGEKKNGGKREGLGPKGKDATFKKSCVDKRKNFGKPEKLLQQFKRVHVKNRSQKGRNCRRKT